MDIFKFVPAWAAEGSLEETDDENEEKQTEVAMDLVCASLSRVIASSVTFVQLFRLILFQRRQNKSRFENPSKSTCSIPTLISLINVELVINVEGCKSCKISKCEGWNIAARVLFFLYLNS